MISLLEIKTVGVATKEQIASHVDHSSRLGFEEAIPRKQLIIIASGPSALNGQWPHEGDTMALNGALGLMHSWGFNPTFWAACDPQELVVNFLKNIPPEVTYFVASKCHPAVFERLRSRDARIFHVGDSPGPMVPVRYGSSITLTALHLARLLGYTDIDVYGWDCCFLEGAHHACEAAAPRETTKVHIRTAPDAPILREFTTTVEWANEVDQALGHIKELALWGVNVTVHGPGMVRAAIDFMNELEPSNADA